MVKVKLVIISLALSVHISAQQIQIPKGINYKYADSSVNARAREVIYAELGDVPTYSLDNGITFIGPVLWTRYREVPAIKNIKGGDVTIQGQSKERSSAKMTQKKGDFKLVWDYLRSEITGDILIRKANQEELTYYWSVIAFDIQEPLFIVETSAHRYILNLSDKLRLVWLDEVPNE